MIVSRLALVVGLVFVSACQVTTTNTPPGLGDGVLLRSTPVRVWDVVEAASIAGFVVRFEEPGKKGRAWFSVRNPSSQEIGIVDVDGRAWRYRPHQRDPEWLGSGTVAAGASRILGAGSDAELVEVPIEAVAERVASDH